MVGSKGLLERIFRILHVHCDRQVCPHIRSMCWLKLSKPLRHYTERCSAMLYPLLTNPPPVPSPMYKSLN